MRIHSVHTREIAAAADTVGALLDGLGDRGGRLWPEQRWPTSPMAFDRGLAVGSRGGHGSIRYAVESHVPRRCVVFRFDPGPLRGTHRLDVQALGPDRSRLTHTLDVRAGARLLPVLPVLRGSHDAMVEDLLARADHLATGTPLRYPRIPRWLRVLTAVEVGLARWRGTVPPARSDRTARPAVTVAGSVVAAVLVGLGALHALWATGSPWPAADRQTLAHWVVGDGAAPPPDWASWAVAALLALAGTSVALAARGSRSRHLPPLVWTAGLVLLARGVGYLPIDLARGLAADYDRIDLAFYSPLCIALGLGALAVARELPARRGQRHSEITAWAA